MLHMPPPPLPATPPPRVRVGPAYRSSAHAYRPCSWCPAASSLQSRRDCCSSAFEFDGAETASGFGSCLCFCFWVNFPLVLIGPFCLIILLLDRIKMISAFILAPESRVGATHFLDLAVTYTLHTHTHAQLHISMVSLIAMQYIIAQWSSGAEGGAV